MLCTKLCWPSGFRKEVKKCEKFRDGQIDGGQRVIGKLTSTFGSGELKTSMFEGMGDAIIHRKSLI